MEIEDFLKDIAEKTKYTSSEAVFGQTRTFNGKAIIPVARLSYGLGGGLGKSKEEKEQGGGGGMGVDIRPIGYLVYSNGEVSYKPIVDVSKAMVVGSILGGLFLLTLKSLIKRL